MDSLTFNFNRFILLLKAELLQDKRSLLIKLVAVFGLLTIFALMNAKGEPSGDQEFIDFHYLWFPIILFIGGIIFTSKSFSELDEKTGAHHYLTLPASTLEKFTSKWLITSIGFATVFSICYWLYALISNGLCDSIFGYAPRAFSLFETHHEYDGNSVFIFIKIYLVIQTLYLTGAVVFRKYVVFKTPLAALAIILAFALAITILARIVLWDWFNGFSLEPQDIKGQPNDTLQNFFNGTFESIGWFCLFYLLPIWMLIIGYFKLKEKEA